MTVNNAKERSFAVMTVVTVRTITSETWLRLGGTYGISLDPRGPRAKRVNTALTLKA